MPFKTVRNDITKVKADAIVNTANPRPTYAAGIDPAIYEVPDAADDRRLKHRSFTGSGCRLTDDHFPFSFW